MPISAKPPSIIDQSPELRPKSRPAVIRANILYNMNSLRRSSANTSITALVCEIRIQQRNLQIPALLSHVITHGFKHPVFLCPIDQSPSVQNCSPESGFGGSPRGSEGGARAHAGRRQADRGHQGADHGGGAEGNRGPTAMKGASLKQAKVEGRSWHRIQGSRGPRSRQI